MFESVCLSQYYTHTVKLLTVLVFGYQWYVNNSYLGRSDPISFHPSLRGALCLQTQGYGTPFVSISGIQGALTEGFRYRFQHQTEHQGLGASQPPAGPSRTDSPRTEDTGFVPLPTPSRLLPAPLAADSIPPAALAPTPPA